MSGLEVGGIVTIVTGCSGLDKSVSIHRLSDEPFETGICSEELSLVECL